MVPTVLDVFSPPWGCSNYFFLHLFEDENTLWFANLPFFNHVHLYVCNPSQCLHALDIRWSFCCEFEGLVVCSKLKPHELFLMFLSLTFSDFEIYPIEPVLTPLLSFSATKIRSRVFPCLAIKTRVK